MHKRTKSAAAGGIASLVAAACVIGGSIDRAAAQARGVIIQIPDDVAPGSSRPAAPPTAPAAPSLAPPPGASRTAGPAPCRGAACGKDVWHVLNTSNRTCLVLSKEDVRGGNDVRKLSTLLPTPRFVVASGGCP